MPNLDPSKVNCNCSKPSKQGKSRVLLSTEGTFGTLYSKVVSRWSCKPVATTRGGRRPLDNFADEFNDEDEDDEFYDDLPVSFSTGEKELITPQNHVSGTETCYTATFTLKGSSYHKHFRKTLKECKERLVNKKPVPIKLSYEPVNIRDENAILVHACPRNSWEPVGYIPGLLVGKVTHAIQNSEIASMKITSRKQ